VNHTLLDRSSPDGPLRLIDHLPECSMRHRDILDCHWCNWAVSTPCIITLLDARADAVALTDSDTVRSGAHGSVAWVVASCEVLRLVEQVDSADVLVPSVRELADRLAGAVSDELGTLRGEIDSAVAPDGPVERRCLQTAGAIAATRLGSPSLRPIAGRLSERTRRIVTELAASISPEQQTVGLIPVIDHLHWKGLPELRTQPEWSRRPAPGTASGVLARRLAGTQLAPGSLEALVVESVIDRATEQLLEVADDLTNAAPAVEYRRRRDAPPASPATKRILWRLALIDWHQSFVDTGRADCWGASTVGADIITSVPWQVAEAITISDSQGLVGATFADRPIGFRSEPGEPASTPSPA
jgi:hypothetical protein